MKVLLGVTSSISAYKAPDICRGFVKAGHDVRCVVTKNALDFVTETSLSTMSGHPVIMPALSETHGEITHIELTQNWCDVFVVAPATANVMGKMANGIADDALTTFYLAVPLDKPRVIFPALNTFMYRHPAVQRNIETLKRDGCFVAGTREALLACNTFGEGALLPTREIISFVEEVAKNCFQKVGNNCK